MERIVSFLLIAIVALMGADRINLLAGATSFFVTPFLVLTPLVVVAEALRLRSTRAKLHIPRQAAIYFLSVSALICVIGVSALLSGDPSLSARRTILLVILAQGATIIALAIINQPRPALILVRAAYVAILLTAVFNVLQLYVYITGNWSPSQPETELFINLTPRTYGPWFPRLSGMTFDQGRSGLLVVIYLYIIFLYAPKSRWRTLAIVIGGLSLLGTLARASILCAIIAGMAYWLNNRRVRIMPRHVVTACIATALLVASAMVLPSLREGTFDSLAPLSGRLSLSEGSSRMHVDLIVRGLAVATSSFHNALLGIGYGNGLMVLEDFFPGDRYANFHSYYITLLAESGIFALVLGVWVLFRPFLSGWGPFVPLLAGLAAFNVFYQSATDPAFWLIIALAWFTVDRVSADRLRDAGLTSTREPRRGSGGASSLSAGAAAPVG